MKNLVTGATGLVGMHILLDLLSKGEKVKATFTKNSKLENVKKLFKFYNKEFLYKEIQWVEMDVEDIIFIAGNSGLSVYHGIKNQIARDIIIDEFNSSAVYKSFSEISFGGIHGVYTFNNLNQLDKELVFKDYEIDNNGSLLLGGVVSSLLLCIGFITFRFRKKTLVSDEQMIARIKRFIRSNLSIVTLKMLEVELNLDYNELNSLSKSFRPAKYIKERRGAIAKEMLLANESISEISKKTGYSETYLVKNKYRFIK